MSIQRHANFSQAHFSNDISAIFDKKSGTLALIGVLSLHGIVAMSLANMAAPDIKPPNVTPPLEISFIAPPPAADKPKEMAVTAEPKPIKQLTKPVEKLAEKPKEKLAEKPKEKPIVKPINKPIEKTVEKPMAKKPVQQPIKPSPEPSKPTEKIIVKPPQVDQNIVMARQLALANERAEQAQKQKQQQELERQQELQRQQVLARQKALENQLIEQQERERKQAEMDRQKALADAKARQADEARAKAEKAKQQADKDKEAEQAQNNAPVSFSAGQASWRRQPSFSCDSEDLENGALTAIIRYTVDKQGNPTSVTLAKSTGNVRVDRQLSMQAKSGKFNPFTKNGVPVVGIVNLPVRCQ
ncbi:TonB family protein [Moraxella osloensis]|mgnify:CR=1 FL=1|uniref:TonB family protein n=1 Tax=Faucicola osloensis TaxID=34062 RepID=UPI00242D0D65|nr:TonB family protein [Moraxella osloensis]